MASLLRDPKATVVLSLLAVVFLAWRIHGMMRPGSSAPAPVAESSALPAPPEVPPALASTPTSEPTPPEILLLDSARRGDTLGGWDPGTEHDPFQPLQPLQPFQAGTRPRRTASEGTAKATSPGPARRLGSSPAIRGVAIGRQRILLSQNRLVFEGDSFAGGILRSIRQDRILVARLAGDTTIALPRGAAP